MFCSHTIPATCRLRRFEFSTRTWGQQCSHSDRCGRGASHWALVPHGLQEAGQILGGVVCRGPGGCIPCRTPGNTATPPPRSEKAPPRLAAPTDVHLLCVAGSEFRIVRDLCGSPLISPRGSPSFVLGGRPAAAATAHGPQLPNSVSMTAKSSTTRELRLLVPLYVKCNSCRVPPHPSPPWTCCAQTQGQSRLQRHA